MRDAPKRCRLDDGAAPGIGSSRDHLVPQGGGRLVPGPSRKQATVALQEALRSGRRRNH